MAKAADIINQASVFAGIKAIGDPLSGDDNVFSLSVLNAMLDSWQTDRLFIPYVAEIVQTVSSSPVTIGTGQTINVARPNEILDTSFTRTNGVDYPLQIVSESDYNEIFNKSISSTYPFLLYYDEKIPTGTLYFYPKINTPTELHLQVNAVLPQFADFQTDYAIKTGYLLAIQLSLAEILCIGVKEVDRQLAKQAMIARDSLRAKNTNIGTLGITSGLKRRFWYYRK